IGTGAPFYYSFSPDGQQMLWFRDGSQFDIYDVAVDKVTQTYDDAPGKFQSPMWSPVDDQVLIGVVGTDADTTDVVVAKGTDRQVVSSGLNAPVSFSWS